MKFNSQNTKPEHRTFSSAGLMQNASELATAAPQPQSFATVLVKFSGLLHAAVLLWQIFA